MKKIIFPLKPRMKRREVGDLHNALALMGLEVGDSERNNRHFGASTRIAGFIGAFGKRLSAVMGNKDHLGGLIQ